MNRAPAALITNYINRVNEHLRKTEANGIVERNREIWAKEWTERNAKVS